MEAPGMALHSRFQSAEMVVRRKRSRSPALLSLDAEEPNNKLLRRRNMDFQLEGGREPIASCKANRAIKKKSKYTVKRKGQRLLRMNFELLKQEMEPIQVVDYLKEKGEIFHKLNRKTIGKKWRTERVESLLNGLFELMSDENENSLLQMIIDALVQSRQTELAQELQNDKDNFLPNEIHDSNETDKTETATSSSHESTEVKVSYEPVVAQDSSEHTDPLSQLRELQQSVVQNINGNEGQFNDLDQNIMQDCTSRLQKITFGSIDLHLQSMSDKSIQKLIDCCKGEEVRKWIISFLGKDDLEILQRLKATTFTVKIFVKDLQRENKYKMFDETTDGCLCAVNKDSLQNKDAQFKTVIEGLELKIINCLLKHDILSDGVKDVLHQIRQADELTDFFCYQNIPKVSYCFMENDVLKSDRSGFISKLRHRRNNSTDCLRMQHISQSDIKEHKTLLEDEIDANWFVSSLQAKGDKFSKDLVKMIEKSSSRRNRTRNFVEFLCKVDNKEYEWFADILQEKHPHLLEILQPEILTNVTEVRHGLLSLYDYLVEELDPEEFCSSLKDSSYEILECAQLSLMRNKRDKCKRFLANILKKENSYLVPEVMNAMKTYKGNIYDTVQLVLEKGSLSQHYRCPLIEKECLKSSKCSFKTEISLTEHAKEGERPFKCPFEGCSRSFTTSKIQNAHIRTHTGERPYLCLQEGCGKAFAWAASYANHVRIHTEEKVYGKAYQSTSTLALEKRVTHEQDVTAESEVLPYQEQTQGERPFKCPFEGCTRSFASSNFRKVHIRTHTGELPYLCLQKGCGKAFASAADYKNHVLIHTGERPYVCTVFGCGKLFTEFSSIYKHVVHTHAKPYTCSICFKKYRRTSTFAMHKRITHGQDVAAESVALLYREQTQGCIGSSFHHPECSCYVCIRAKNHKFGEKQRRLDIEKEFKNVSDSYEEFRARLLQSADEQRLDREKVFQDDKCKEKLENQKLYDRCYGSPLPYLPHYNTLYPLQNAVRPDFSSEHQKCRATSYSDLKRETSIPSLSVNPLQLKQTRKYE